MSIRSDAFSRVKLTGKDAKKFKSQVNHGRPKPAAVKAAKKGAQLARAFSKTGRVRIAIAAE